MRTEINFSKTERLPDGGWLCVIAPALHSAHNGVILSPGRVFEYIKRENEFDGRIISKNKTKKPNEIIIKCFKGFPCVGIGYETYLK